MVKALFLLKYSAHQLTHALSLEKKTRDKAIRSLRKFLSTGSNLDEIELIKLWKGLFYCTLKL